MQAGNGRKPLFLLLSLKIIQDESGGSNDFDAREAFL